ncbi:zinc-ribbon domain-containing protein [uncultured Litoreibacter sp.]|uniref:zinc-ribbon domain-containing protein n=1 Tax=uncultured Litoreibacter sp. TaxID=1392394 RepID=UPI0026341CAD|nr:zinc-ribbon domain-containing protein [uncultured Litoreibacter sp.]
MRLVCPNCDAEYEVDDSLVPAEGRDVQCSNCTTTWFQAAANAPQDPVEAEQTTEPEPDPKPESEQEPEPEPQSEPAPQAPADAPEAEAEEPETEPELPAAAIAALSARKPTVSAEALDVIHEEVALETAARKAEMGGVETQPDLGLDDTESEARASAARDRMARRRGLEPDTTTIEDEDVALEPAPQRDDFQNKKELLPDIEEINSTLSPEAAEAEAEAARRAEQGNETLPTRGSSGFRLGFGLMLLLAVGLMLLYVYAPQLAQRVPALTGALESYVSGVDSLRIWLDTATQGLVDKMGDSANAEP